MSKKRVLTGVTTTGIPHLGNYVGAFRRKTPIPNPSSSSPTTTASSNATSRR